MRLHGIQRLYAAMRALALGTALCLASCVSYGLTARPFRLHPPEAIEGRPGYFSMAWLVRRGSGEFEAQVCSMSVVWKVHAICGVTSQSAIVGGSTLVPLKGKSGGKELGDTRAYLGVWNVDGTEVWRWIDDRDIATETRDVQKSPSGESAIVVIDGGGDLTVGKVELANGRWIWRASLGLPYRQEYGAKALALPDGGAIIASWRLETGLWVFRVGPSGEVLWERDDTPWDWLTVAGVAAMPEDRGARVIWWSGRQYYGAEVSDHQLTRYDPYDTVGRSSRTWSLPCCPLTADTLTVEDNQSRSTWTTTVYWLSGGATRVENVSPLGTFQVAPDRVVLVGHRVNPEWRLVVAELTPGKIQSFWLLDFGHETLDASAVWADAETVWFAGGGAHI